MAAGDNPFMVSRGRVTWNLEATWGTAPASGAWSSFGPRVGELRDPGPTNTWLAQRNWNDGREASYLDRMSVDYGPVPLAEFKLQDPKILGFGWGQEVSAPAATDFDGGALAGSYRRHVATPTTNSTFNGMAMSVQIDDRDSAANNTRTTYVGGVMAELEVAGNEGAEVTYTPTPIFRKEDTSVALNTVTEADDSTFKHYHGYLEAFGQQVLRVLSWRFRIINDPQVSRYHNDTEPLYAYEYPFGDVSYQFTCRAVADGKQFSGFGNRDILGLVRNGDIGTGEVRFTRTAAQDQARIVVGSADNALALRSAPRVRQASGGRVVYELDFETRVSQYEWIDTNTSRYFPS